MRVHRRGERELVERERVDGEGGGVGVELGGGGGRGDGGEVGEVGARTHQRAALRAVRPRARRVRRRHHADGHAAVAEPRALGVRPPRARER